MLAKCFASSPDLPEELHTGRIPAWLVMAERIAAVKALRKSVLEALPHDGQRLQSVYRITMLKRG